MKDTILNKVKELGNDITMFIYDDTIDLTIDDLECFDEDLLSVGNSNKVDEFLEFLSNTCKSIEKDFYTTYYYDDFEVIVGYSSFDI